MCLTQVEIPLVLRHINPLEKYGLKDENETCCMRTKIVKYNQRVKEVGL